jgi:predicted permease
MGASPVEHIWSLLSVIGNMMFVIGLGFLAAKFGVLNEHGRKNITELIITLIFPCYVINGFIKNIGMLNGADALFALGLASLIQGATLLANHFMYRRLPVERRSVLRYATAISNSAFLGLPPGGERVRKPGLIYASIFVIPQRINCFGIAINYFTPSEHTGALQKTLTQPSILATIVGTVIMLAGWRPPQPVVGMVSSIAHAPLLFPCS